MSAFDVTLDHTSPVPLYHQVASQLQAAVAERRIQRGEFLPSEIELAASWGVSRPTARRAIQALVDAGLVVRRRGVGSQVISHNVQRPVQLSSFYDHLAASGRKPTTSILVFEQVAADEGVAESLEIPVGDEVLHIERARYADGVPLAILRNWLVLDAVGELTPEQLERGGLYAHLRARGITPTRAALVIGAAAAREDEANTLALDVGAPVLYMRRVMSDERGRVVELGKHAYNPIHYQMVAEVTA